MSVSARAGSPTAGTGHRARFDAWPAALLAIVLGTSALIVLQLCIVLWLGLFEGELGGVNVRYGLDNYVAVYSDSFTIRVTLTTVWFSLVSLLVALAFGLPAAWLVER